MSPNVLPVLEAARALSFEERQELIDRLVEEDGDGTVPELSEEWKQEIRRRLAEYRAGQTDTVSWEEVKAKTRARRASGG